MIILPENIQIMGTWYFIYSDGKILVAKNKIVQTGLNFLAALFIGEEANNFAAHIALGTGNTAAQITDVKLQTEVFRKNVSQKFRVNGLARFRTFIQSTEGNGDYAEVGLYVKSTNIAESGILFNRVVTPVSKAEGQSLTIETRLNIAGV